MHDINEMLTILVRCMKCALNVISDVKSKILKFLKSKIRSVFGLSFSEQFKTFQNFVGVTGADVQGLGIKHSKIPVDNLCQPKKKKSLSKFRAVCR